MRLSQILRFTLLLAAVLIVSLLLSPILPNATPRSGVTVPPVTSTPPTALPAGLAPIVGATLAADDSSDSPYPALDDATILTATNPAQRLTSSFTLDGIRLKAVGSASLWGMHLAAIGLGKSLRTVPSVVPQMQAGRVEYRHGTVTEWYLNSPLGVEQGFTLAKPVRLLDTRVGATAFVAPGATLTAGQTLTLPGAFTFNGATVPGSVKALVGNAPVANDGNGTPAGFATLSSDGVLLPLASNLNFVPKQAAPNAITVGIGSDGKDALYSSSGGDFVIDITGYFSDAPAPNAARKP